MKLSSATILAAATLLLAGCNSLDNPFGNLFHTGRDERVYNPQTGQWEWPPDKRAAHEKKSAAVASALETPGQGFNDTRYWDAQRNQWVMPSQTRATPASTPKPQIAPSAATQLVSSSPQTAPAPARPQAARATGTYNSRTGKIEWQDSGGYIPPPAPRPEEKKHWYWPF